MMLLMHPKLSEWNAWWYNKRGYLRRQVDTRVMNDNLSNEFDRITDLGKARSDEYTDKLLAFVQDLEASCPEPFIPLLADIALVRALIVHLVIQYGPERGLIEARDAFNTTFDQMKPILQNMQEEKGHPPQ
jgi:hypothetical protein